MARLLLKSLSIFLLFLSFDSFANESGGINLKPTNGAFRKNIGQWSSDIIFKSQQGSKNIYFFNNKISYGVSRFHQDGVPIKSSATEKEDKKSDNNLQDLLSNTNTPDPNFNPHKVFPKAEYLVWDFVFNNSNPTSVTSEGIPYYSGINYLGRGKGVKGQTNVPSYNRIIYKNLYNNIDLVYYETNEGIKYDFILKPGADIKDISIHIDGPVFTEISSTGELIINTQWGKYAHGVPFTYQTIDGKQLEVKVKYKVLSKNTFGFELVEGGKSYNPSFNLIVDPIHVDWSSYFYGNDQNLGVGYYAYTWIYDVDADKEDFVYIVGLTSEEYPKDPGIYDTSFNGGYYDGFLAKMKDDGSDLVYLTYIGGSQWEWLFSMAVMENGNAFIYGFSYSRDFPTTPGAYMPDYPSTVSSYYTGTLTAIRADGSSLIYSTYLGNGYVYGSYWFKAMDVTEKGEVYLGISDNGNSFPKTHDLNGPGHVYGGTTDGYVVKMKKDGSGILKSIKVGGLYEDYITGVYVDEGENVYVCGYTNSDNLKVTWGVQGFGMYNGGFDGFFYKIDSLTTKYVISKYIGGSGDDIITAIYGNKNGEVFLGGATNSNNLPSRTNSYTGGAGAGFVMRVRKDGLRPIWSTYFGSFTWYYPSWASLMVRDIVATAKEEPILVGTNYYSSIPTTSGAFHLGGGQSDGYVLKFDYTGQLQFGSPIGGTGFDYMYAATTKRIGCVTYIITGGYTNSVDFPTSTSAWKPTARTSFYYSAALVKMRDTLKIAKIDIGPDHTQCNEVYSILDAENIGASYKWNRGDTMRSIIVTKPGQYHVTATYGCGTESDTINITLKHRPKNLYWKDTIHCKNFTMELDAKNDTIPEISYLWNTSETTQKINVNTPGLYTVVMSTPNCGFITEDILIKQLHAPKIDLPNDSLYCGSINVMLDAGDPGNELVYSWNTGDSLQHKLVTGIGKYKVTAKNFCGIKSDSVTYTIDFKPVADIGEDTTFCNSISIFKDAGNLSIYTSFEWSNGESMNVSEFTEVGKHWLKLSNPCGVSIDSFEIKMIRTPFVDLGDDLTLCDNVNLIADAGNEENNAQYLWQPGNFDTKSIGISNPGQYTVIASNKCGNHTDTLNVKLLQTPTVSLGEDSVFCNHVGITLDAGNILNEASYVWNTGQLTQTINATSNGTYIVKVNNYCGEATDSIRLGVIYNPTINLGEDTIYCGTYKPTRLYAKNQTNNVQYLWNTGEKTENIVANSPGKYLVSVSNKCATAIDSITFFFAKYPVVNLPKDTTFCDVVYYNLNAGSDGMYYEWEPTGETAQEITAREFGLYTVRVTNELGCTAEDNIRFTEWCDVQLFVPTAFSPNQDGRNELFKPVVKDATQFEFKIYNRWGQLVFSSDDSSAGWDGTYNGIPCPEGAYIWEVIVQGGPNRKIERGTVTLLK